MTESFPDFTTRKVQDIFILELPEKLTAETEKPFNEKVEWALADTPGAVIVDFARVREADAAGIAAFKFLLKRSYEVDIPVVLAAVGPGPRALLESAGFLKHAQIADSVQHAIDSGMA